MSTIVYRAHVIRHKKHYQHYNDSNGNPYLLTKHQDSDHRHFSIDKIPASGTILFNLVDQAFIVADTSQRRFDTRNTIYECDLWSAPLSATVIRDGATAISNLRLRHEGTRNKSGIQQITLCSPQSLNIGDYIQFPDDTLYRVSACQRAETGIYQILANEQRATLP